MVVDEVWLSVPGYEGSYAVSDCGRVRSLSRRVRCRGGGYRTLVERILSHGFSQCGYPMVALRDGKSLKTYTVHRLVARAFLGEPDTGQVVRHLNGNPTDNSLSNLRWGTRVENGADMVLHGRTLSSRTHCKNDHEFTSENTYLNPRGARTCRQCRRDQNTRRVDRSRRSAASNVG